VSVNTSHKVNLIPELQWLEVWIQILAFVAICQPTLFSSWANETHQKSQNSRNSVRVGHRLMVSLWMLTYHTTQGRYSISFPAH
jgi:hypothetical protein